MKLFGYEFKKQISQPNKLVSTIGTIPFISRWGLANEKDFDSMVKSYRSWVYVCVTYNSTTVASVPLRLYVGLKSKSKNLLVETKKVEKKTKDYLFSSPIMNNLECVRKAIDIREVTDHPFLKLLKNVNPFINRFDLFENSQMFLELIGNSYWYLVKNQFGLPQEIWLIPANRMHIVPDKDQFIKGYVYRPWGQEQSVYSYTTFDVVPFEKEEIIHFKFPSSTSMFYGTSPLAAVTEAYNTNADINQYARSMFKNMGMPEGVLETEQELSEDEFIRLKAEWKNIYGGVKNAAKTALLEKGLKYKPITFTPRELGFLIGKKTTVNEIAAAFGVPISKLTSENVNLANAYVGERQYRMGTVLPRLRRVEEKLNEQLIPLYDDNLFCAYDDPVPENDELELRKLEIMLRTGYMSINELRGREGLEPVEWGDKPILPAGSGPLFSDSGIEDVSGRVNANNPPKKRVIFRLVK